MKKKYIIGGIILLIINILVFIIINKSFNLKYDKTANDYNKKIEGINSELNELRKNQDEINIDGHTISLYEWKKINNTFHMEFYDLLYSEYLGKNKDSKYDDLVDDDYFRYKYITYRLYNENQRLSSDNVNCYNCHYVDKDLLKKDYKEVFGFELDDNIIKKYAYKIEKGKVYNSYNFSNGSHYAIKFNNVENMKIGKKYTFDLINLEYLHIPDKEMKTIIEDSNIPFFANRIHYQSKTKILLEYDNEKHLKSFIIKHF